MDLLGDDLISMQKVMKEMRAAKSGLFTCTKLTEKRIAIVDG
jgi:hypothetical protein